MFRTLIAGAALAGLCGAAEAAPYPALSRPALEARHPERQVMQMAALAGKRIVAVGERGIIVLSDDDGASWRQARAVPVSITLTAVAFAGDRLGWAVGHAGVVLHTADGGDTWRKQVDGAALAQAAVRDARAALTAEPGDPGAARALRAAEALVAEGPDKPLLDVLFADARRGWIAGAYGLLFETSDGGASWRSIGHRLANPKALHLYALGADGEVMYVAGEGGQLHRSLDGGGTFAALPSPYKGSWFTLAPGAGGALLVAGLRGNAWRSADRGDTWEAVRGTPPVSFVDATPLRDGSILLANQAGQLFASRPGVALRPLPLPPLPPLTSVLALDDGALLALGFTGVVRLAAPQEKKASK